MSPRAGPDWKSFVLTQLLVLLPIGLFFGWVVVDMDDDELPPVIIITLAALCAFTFMALLLTGLKNPGVIDRHPHRSAPELYGSLHTAHVYMPMRGYGTHSHNHSQLNHHQNLCQSAD